MDLTKAREELGYEPLYDVKAGVRDYVESMERFKIQPTHLP